MKRLLLVLPFLLVLGFSAQAQTGTDTFGAPEVYTVGDLDQLGKLELTAIYIGQVQKLNLLVPYVPFNQKGEAVSLTAMGIPNSKDNNNYIKKLDESGNGHNEAVDSTMTSIVPYADKPQIIKAILFVQDVIQRIEVGF